jgi:hypothetical protein
LVPSVRRCPPCLLSGGWFGVLFPAIFSYASRQSNELAPPFVVVLPEKKTKKAAKTMLVIHDESDILWLFSILGTRGKDSHDPDTQEHSTL